MTVTDAIRLADLTRPNELDRELKLRWLSSLDGRLNAEVLAPHGNAVELSPYTQQTPPKTELLVPWPYDDIYVRYLVMMIDFENGEFARYNNDAAAFNRIWQSWAGFYTHNHSPAARTALQF